MEVLNVLPSQIKTIIIIIIIIPYILCSSFVTKCVTLSK